MSQPFDAELVARFIRGDREATEVLARLHYEELLRQCRELTGNDTDVEDLAQETFLRMIECRSSCDPTLPFDVWLRPLADSCLDEWRRNDPARQLSVLEDVDSVAADPSPDDEQSDEARRRQIRKAVQCGTEFERWAIDYMPTWSLTHALIARWRGRSWRAVADDYLFSNARAAQRAIGDAIAEILSTSPEAYEDFTAWLRHCQAGGFSRDRLHILGILDVETLRILDVA